MDLNIENSYGEVIIAGIDEAGRGPLAGPVTAAAVILDRNNIIPGIKDSKKLSRAQRESLYTKITANYLWSVGTVGPEEIDEINILEATKKACLIAAAGLSVRPEVIIVDGNMKFTDPRFVSIVKGDNLSLSIAAASIVAKVTRDEFMRLLDREFPEYKWHKNVGYGTAEHLRALHQFGRSPHHRRSFRIKNI